MSSEWPETWYIGTKTLSEVEVVILRALIAAWPEDEQ